MTQIQTLIVTASNVVAEIRNMIICWYFTAWEIEAPPRMAPVIIPGIDTRPMTLFIIRANERVSIYLICVMVGRMAVRSPGFRSKVLPTSHLDAPKARNISICDELELY